MHKILRAALYIRVSKSEQAMYGYSLPSQVSFLQKYAESHGMVVVGVYADEGKSARKQLKKRKQIHVLLHDIEEDKIDVIIFWKMDRWFRNVSDFYKVQDVLDSHNVKWIAAAEESCNMETREGRLNVNIHLSIGQNESDTTSERIRFTRGTMINEGRAIFGDSSLVFGFKIVESEGKKMICKDPELVDVVYDMVDHLKTYQNKRKTCVYIQEKYNVHLTEFMLRSFLRSDFPCGMYKNNASYCESYFSQEEWTSIKSLFNVSVKSAPSGRVYLFTSMIRCPVCHGPMAGAWRSTKDELYPDGYFYYRCKKHSESLCSYSSRVIERHLEAYLLESLTSELDHFVMNLNQIDTNQKKAVKKVRSESDVKKELERLNYMFQKGRIGFDFYEKEFERLSNELETLVPVPAQSGKDYKLLYDVIQNFLSTYDELDREDKKAFWHSIIKEIKIDEYRNVVSIDFE